MVFKWEKYFIFFVLGFVFFQFQNCIDPSHDDSIVLPSTNNDGGGLSLSGNGDVYTGKETLVSREDTSYSSIPFKDTFEPGHAYYDLPEGFACAGDGSLNYRSQLLVNENHQIISETCTKVSNLATDVDFSLYNLNYITSGNRILEKYNRAPNGKIPHYNELLCKVPGSREAGIDIVINRFTDGGLSASIVIGKQTSTNVFLKNEILPLYVNKQLVDGVTYYYSAKFQFLLAVQFGVLDRPTAKVIMLLDNEPVDLNMDCTYNEPPQVLVKIGDPYGVATNCSAEADWCIGANQQYKLPSDVLGNHDKSTRISDGDIVELLPGTYKDTARINRDNVILRSAPGSLAKIDCSAMRPYQGKSCLFTMGQNNRFENLIITGARWLDNNEACLRNTPGVTTYVKGLTCYNSNNGILGSGGSWYIEDSLFFDNGNSIAEDITHNLNFAPSDGYDCENLHLKNVITRDASYESALKSRCLQVLIEDSLLIDGQSGRAADFSYGGEVLIKDTTIFQPLSENSTIIHHGPENCDIPGQLSLDNVLVINHNNIGRIKSLCEPIRLLNGTSFQGPIDILSPE